MDQMLIGIFVGFGICFTTTMVVFMIKEIVK